MRYGKEKTKLTLSGNLKKSISNIERAKTQGKNSVFIERKNTKFAGRKPLVHQENLLVHQENLLINLNPQDLLNHLHQQTITKKENWLNKELLED